MEFYQVSENSYLTWELIFFDLFKRKKKFFFGENLSTEEFRHKFHRLSSSPSTPLDLYILPNIELILRNCQLASYRQLKYLACQ